MSLEEPCEEMVKEDVAMKNKLMQERVSDRVKK
jgi:hypothetical protein